jgi:hypothetical protein
VGHFELWRSVSSCKSASCRRSRLITDARLPVEVGQNTFYVAQGKAQKSALTVARFAAFPGACECWVSAWSFTCLLSGAVATEILTGQVWGKNIFCSPDDLEEIVAI